MQIFKQKNTNTDRHQKIHSGKYKSDQKAIGHVLNKEGRRGDWVLVFRFNAIKKFSQYHVLIYKDIDMN